MWKVDRIRSYYNRCWAIISPCEHGLNVTVMRYVFRNSVREICRGAAWRWHQRLVITVVLVYMGTVSMFVMGTV